MSEIDEQRRAASLLDAQAKASALFQEIETLGLIRPGVTESQLNKEIYRLSRDKYHAGRHWHKRIVRAGANTVHPYQVDPEDLTVAEDDLVFIDLGPVFADWEADFGRTYVLGTYLDKQRICRDLETVFIAGKRHFQANPEITGSDLYQYVCDLAAQYGWDYGNGHAGHIIGEFPREKIHGDKVALYIHPENHQPLHRPDRAGHNLHGILEVHLVDKAKHYGAFFEELLTLGDMPVLTGTDAAGKAA
jgi:Xaa-Pro aminopeptidase